MFLIFCHPRSQMPQLLRSAEALTMPRVQVIVLNANMCCLQCRDRVSRVLSKMDKLLDYVVDAAQNKVTVKGRVNPKKRVQRIRLMENDDKRRKTIELQRLGGEGYPSCTSDHIEQRDYNSSCEVKSTYNLIQRTCCFCCVSS